MSLVALGAGLVLGGGRRCQRKVSARRAGLTARAALTTTSVDRSGRRWVTSLHKVGPPNTQANLEGDSDVLWRRGHGSMRPVCYVADSVTSLAWHGETLCMGTEHGLVRTVDLTSGSVVGEYYAGSHMPTRRISALHYDGSAVVAGDDEGHLRIWRAALPGSWGFAHSPDWSVEAAGSGPGEATGRAHAAGVAGLAALADGRLASGGRDGLVCVWELAEVGARCSQRKKLPRPVSALGASWPEMGVFAGLDDGTLWMLKPSADEELQAEEVMTFGAAVTAITWCTGLGSFVLGLQNGSVLTWKVGSNEAAPLPNFHLHKVCSLSTQTPQEHHGLAGPCHRLVSTDVRGRLGAWDLSTGELLWGLEGLDTMFPVALLDSTRVIVSGLVVVEQRPDGIAEFSDSWKAPLPDHLSATQCEAVLRLDLLESASPAPQELFWPAGLRGPGPHS